MNWIGTSGYNYPEWRGSFYPADLPESRMLPYYAERFSTVEINYTFYRFPNEKTLASWAATTPDGFVFTLKAPRRITHEARLKDCADTVQAFYARARTLGPKLGAVLFQLPPFLRKDPGLLEQFLACVPENGRAAFEFRNASWHDDEVFELLRSRNAALCISDSEKLSTPVVATADFGYYRLRDEGYTEADIAAWAETIRARQHPAAYVYFKHEEEGKGPEFAHLLGELLSSP